MGGLYGAVMVRGFRRYATYRMATAAGVFTNSVFGLIISYSYIALWDQRPHLGGYTEPQVLTYAWVGQALLMTMALMGGGFEAELMERIRSGAIAVDLYRPDPTVTRSGLERRFRALLRRSGLPRPSMNFVVAGYELDCYWPEHLLAVELDTYGTHGSRLSFEEDRKRQRKLGLLGITLERVTDRQLDSEADEVLRAVAARLGAASYLPLT